MKPKYLMLFTLFVAMAVLAQTNTNTPPIAPVPVPVAANNLLLALIPLLVPIIVAVLKNVISTLPTWTIPIIASALGELLNVVSGLAGGPTTSALNGLLLGSAGVGVRELLDQVKSKVKPATT